MFLANSGGKGSKSTDYPTMYPTLYPTLVSTLKYSTIYLSHFSDGDDSTLIRINIGAYLVWEIWKVNELLLRIMG